jgi:hypothetical protein
MRVVRGVSVRFDAQGRGTPRQLGQPRASSRCAAAARAPGGARRATSALSAPSRASRAAAPGPGGPAPASAAAARPRPRPARLCRLLLVSWLSAEPSPPAAAAAVAAAPAQAPAAAGGGGGGAAAHAGCGRGTTRARISAACSAPSCACSASLRACISPREASTRLSQSRCLGGEGGGRRRGGGGRGRETGRGRARLRRGRAKAQRQRQPTPLPGACAPIMVRGARFGGAAAVTRTQPRRGAGRRLLLLPHERARRLGHAGRPRACAGACEGEGAARRCAGARGAPLAPRRHPNPAVTPRRGAPRGAPPRCVRAAPGRRPPPLTLVLRTPWPRRGPRAAACASALGAPDPARRAYVGVASYPWRGRFSKRRVYRNGAGKSPGADLQAQGSTLEGPPPPPARWAGQPAALGAVTAAWFFTPDRVRRVLAPYTAPAGG